MKRNYIILGCIVGATALAVLLLSADDITSNGELAATGIAEGRAPEIYGVEDLISQIKNGDLSSMTDEDEASLKQLNFEITAQLNELEWVECDLNGDGKNELIVQEKHWYNEEMKCIKAIFAFQGQKTKLVIHDNVETGRFYFLCKNGNIVYHYYLYGVINEDCYSYYTFDNDMNITLAYALEIFNINDTAELGDGWSEDHPDMTETGMYYTKYTKQNGDMVAERINEAMFLSGFEEMTGFSYFDVKPEWNSRRV
ncbi:MAG: hypothetical protein FWG53_11525 [Clostridiales bacterium]|nr:hypothetical protein [Clostridiales bacterium]